MEMERVVAHSPRNRTFLSTGASNVGLAINADIHNVVLANRTVVYDNIPRPERHSVPLFDFKSWLVFFGRCNSVV